IVDCGNPSVNAMDRLGEALAICPRPIVMFVEDDDEALAREAVRIGVSEYVVRGLAQERVQPLVKIAIERFRLVQSLHDEVRQLKADLEARKVIERAKGVLMARRGFAEAEAFDAMRRLAMQQGKPLRDVAAYVLVIANTLDDGNSDSLELMRDLATGQDKSVVEIANDIVAVSVLLGEGDERRD
ncbi:MAG: ANTAR domain-containing protein, partial [Pseudomonadota bacterium]